MIGNMSKENCKSEEKQGLSKKKNKSTANLFKWTKPTVQI